VDGDQGMADGPKQLPVVPKVACLNAVLESIFEIFGGQRFHF
jgi:hypothetical protein